MRKSESFNQPTRRLDFLALALCSLESAPANIDMGLIRTMSLLILCEGLNTMHRLQHQTLK